MEALFSPKDLRARRSMEAIFSPEELLAIANDGGDDDSSTSHVSDSEDEESDAARVPAPSVASGAHAAVLDTTPGARRGAAVSHDPDPPSHQHQTASHNEVVPKDRGEEKSGASDSDATSDGGSDNDGFMEWFEKEKRAAEIKMAGDAAVAKRTDQGTELQKSVDVADKATEIQNSVEGGATCHGQGDEDTAIQKSAEGGVPCDGQGNKPLKIELGASVLQWISSAKSEGGTAAKRSRGSTTDASTQYLGIGGVLALEQPQQEAVARPAALLMTPAAHPRSLPGHEDATATFEEVVPGSCLEKTAKKRGRVFRAAAAARPSAPGGTVECVARWEAERGCYVLELVAVVVKEPTAAVAAGAGARDSPPRAAAAWDPHSRAQRAEDQLQKLKLGKGRGKTTRVKRAKHS